MRGKTRVTVSRELVVNPWGFIKNYIMEHEITPKQLADETGIPSSTCRNYFNGQRETPDEMNLTILREWILERIDT